MHFKSGTQDAAECQGIAHQHAVHTVGRRGRRGGALLLRRFLRQFRLYQPPRVSLQSCVPPPRVQKTGSMNLLVHLGAAVVGSALLWLISFETWAGCA